MNAEYIQATSRVGRNNPGIVVTLYNGLRSRDKSYYEQFVYYHRTFYKYVESTSVTPYSARAIEKALHCAFVAIIRHTIKRYNSNESARNFKKYDNDIEYIKYNMIERIDSIVQRQAEVKHAQEWLDWYLECWEKCVESNPNGLVYFDYKKNCYSYNLKINRGFYNVDEIIKFKISIKNKDIINKMLLLYLKQYSDNGIFTYNSDDDIYDILLANNIYLKFKLCDKKDKRLCEEILDNKEEKKLKL